MVPAPLSLHGIELKELVDEDAAKDTHSLGPMLWLWAVQCGGVDIPNQRKSEQGVVLHLPKSKGNVWSNVLLVNWVYHTSINVWIFRRGKSGWGFYLWEEEYAKYLRTEHGIRVDLGQQGGWTEEIITRAEVEAHGKPPTWVADVVKEEDPNQLVANTVKDMSILLRALQLFLCVVYVQ